MSEQSHTDASHENKVEVVVITTSGTYPKSGTDEVPANQKVRIQLDKAARELKIVDTNGWVARVGAVEIDPDKSYKDNSLSGVIKIDYHKREGGGGCE